MIAARNGYETVCPDLPGYGLTRVASSRMVDPLWVYCVSALIEAELARDGRPIVLFGVSLGGLLAEISFLLGFSEPSAFFRAFKRWTGRTPIEQRATLLAGAAR